jgi:hypothetical protein
MTKTTGERAAEQVAAVRDYLASGERDMPAVLAALPDQEREQLITAGRQLVDTVAARLAQLEQNRAAQ